MTKDEIYAYFDEMWSGRACDFDVIEDFCSEQESRTQNEMIQKACNVYADLLSAQGYNPIDVNKELVRMKKALES